PAPPSPAEPRSAPPPSPAAPHEEEHEPTEDEHMQSLAQQLTNPIADLASIPFQFNWAHGVGPDDALALVLNIQPVVPVHLTKDWNLIGRFIMPLVGQPSLGPNQPAAFGMGDITFSLFASPSKPSKFVWGIGPVAGLPGGTEPAINSGKWLL